MKTKLSKRILAVLTAFFMCFSMGLTCSAEGINPMSINSTISGYQQKLIAPASSSIEIECTGSGIGGMGVTVETSSDMTVILSMSLYEYSTGRIVLDHVQIMTNDHVEFHDLLHYGGGTFSIQFHNVPDGVAFNCQTWIYG